MAGERQKSGYSPAMFIRLELEAHHPLHLTRRTDRTNRAEAVQASCRISKISNKRAAGRGKVGSCVDAVELRMVESIKSVEPGFEPVMLSESKTL